MNRKKKLMLNIATGLSKQIVVVICGFILPRYILLYYGSAVNGLISSITNFLGFISLLDMGVGAVVQANLYAPLAQKDNQQLSRIIKSSEKFFRRLACIFLAYLIVLACLFPNVICKEYDAIFSVSLLVVIAISTFVQYFFGMTYQLLLNADQKAFVPQILVIVTVILNTFLSIQLMQAGASIHTVKLVTACIYFLRPIGQSLYVKHNYKIDKKIKLLEEPIKQKWNGLSQHIASVICQNIDVVILTMVSTLENVSIYSVYYMVTNGVNQIILSAAVGLESLFGNMIAKAENEKLLKTFNMVEWIMHTAVTIVFTIAAITIVPFVSVYTKDISDVNYIVPAFGSLLVLAYAALCLRIPYFRVIKAAGHFKQTQNGAYISALLNVVLSLLLVFKYGLVGTAIGTLVAMAYHTCYFVAYLRKNILVRSIHYFMKYVLVDGLIAALSIYLTHNISMQEISYPAWVIYAIKVFGITIGISLIVNILCHRQNIKEVFVTLKVLKK